MCLAIFAALFPQVLQIIGFKGLVCGGGSKKIAIQLLKGKYYGPTNVEGMMDF